MVPVGGIVTVMKTRACLLILAVMLITGVVVHGQTNTMIVNLDDEAKAMLKAATQDTWVDMKTLVATFVGGILAMLGGVCVNVHNHKVAARQRKQDDEEFDKRIRASIKRELIGLQMIFTNGIGGHLSKVKDREIFQVKLALTQDYFTVFHQNAVHLGKLDPQISEKIISVYLLMKAMIEELKINNQYIDDWRRMKMQLQSPDGDRSEFRLAFQQQEEWLRQQCSNIKKLERELTEKAAALVRLL